MQVVCKTPLRAGMSKDLYRCISWNMTWLLLCVACLPQRTVIAVEHLPESVQKVEYYYWPSMRCTAVHSSYLLSHGLSGPNIKLFKCAELPANSCCTREVGLLVYSWNWRLAYLLTWTLQSKEQPTKKSHQSWTMKENGSLRTKSWRTVSERKM